MKTVLFTPAMCVLVAFGLLAFVQPGEVRAVSVPTNGDGLINLQAFKLAGGGGSNDHDLNSTNETIEIWDALDAGQGPIVTLPKFRYNIQNLYRNTTAATINYDGGNDFGGDSGWGTIGAGVGGNDFSVRARGFLRFNDAGTYSIAAGSDDGRQLTLTHDSGSSVYAGFTATGGQLSTPPTGGNTVGFNGTTGHNRSVGVFTVAEDEVLELNSFFFERSGGDSFEVSIKAGSDTTFGGTGDGWALLTDGVANIDVSTTNAFADNLLNVDAFELHGGANDGQLNNTAEAGSLWTYIDANPGFTGGLAVPQNKIYNVANRASDQDVDVNYVGGGGGSSFPGDKAYASINNDGPGGAGGPITGGNDFSVRANALLEFTVGGTYSIAALSDDGRWLQLQNPDGSPFSFSAHGGQIDSGSGTGTDFLQKNGTTGHDHSSGVFTVAAGDVLVLNSLFFERGGGDAFEIALKAGSDTNFGGTGDGWQLLTDGVLGVRVSSAVPEPMTMLAVGMSVAGLGGYIRKRRRS